MLVLTVGNDLVLRGLKNSDAGALFTLIDSNRLYLVRFLPWVETAIAPEHAVAFIHFCEREWRTGNGAHFGVFLDGRLVGHVSLMFIKPGHKAEIGYWIAEDVSGRGLTRRAVQATLNYAFNDLGLKRLLISCRPDNTASAAIARRLGFQYEGRERMGERHGDRFYDLDRYALLASEVGTAI